MLNSVLKDLETAVRTLYAAAVGEDAALDDNLINEDHAPERLRVVRPRDKDTFYGYLSYTHPDGRRIIEIEVRTLKLSTARLD